LKKAEEKVMELNDGLEFKVQERTHELRQANESLKRAQKEVVDISEKERSRLGQDLHDGLAQELTGACFMIQSIKNNFNRSAAPKAEKVLTAALQLLKNALENCRRLAKNLYPIELERYGLPMSLRELSINTSKIYQIQCEFYLEGPETADDSEIVKTQLYRIVQECVQNAIRHARPKHIDIRMRNLSDQIILEVCDDGIGMATVGKDEGMGFRIMNHRAQMIGAEITVTSQTQKGTGIRCIWPRLDASRETLSERDKEIVHS
jgi:signal transduction histidine kinase